MASMVIMAIISMNLVTLMTNQAAGVNKIKAEYTMGLVVNEVGQILANADICKAHLINNAGPLSSYNSGETAAANTISRDGTNDGIIYTANTNSDEAQKLGDGSVKIKSFTVSSWIPDPLPSDGTSTANFNIKFFQRGSSFTIDKSVKLNIITAAGAVTKCFAVGFYDKTLAAGGIANCPDTINWVLIGTGRFSFCIDKSARGRSTYSAAQSACSGVADARLGIAHLCDFEEWSTACLTSNALGMNDNTAQTAGIDSPSWEWITSAPTSSATLSAPSTLTVIGGAILSTSTPCLTVKTNVTPDGDEAPATPFTSLQPKYRCCFH